MRIFRLRTSIVILLACSTALAQPRSKSKPASASQADVDRLEKKVEAQQQLLDKLVKLQQQYAQAVAALAEGGAPVIDKPVDRTTDAPVDRPVDRPSDKPADKPKPPVKAVMVKPKPTGAGTVVGKITGAPGAVVYIEDIVATTSGTATMKQQGKQFIPQTLVVQKGTKVEFPNLDAIFHNVFSMSPDNTFDLGSYPKGDSKSVTMSRAGVVTVYCNMHPQMVGHILVVPNGNFVQVGADGFFRLPNVPAGSHKIVAWAPNSRPVSVQATIGDGEVVTVELELKKGKAGTHTKKDGLPYGSYEQ